MYSRRIFAAALAASVLAVTLAPLTPLPRAAFAATNPNIAGEITYVEHADGMFVFDNGDWAEVSRADGLPKFRYRETGRGDESIFMEDDGRGVKIRLDIRNRTIFYTGPGEGERPLYTIDRYQ